MDEELEQLYRAKWDALSKAIPRDCGMSTPLLAAVPTEYENSKFRLLIIGKETHSWLGDQSLSAPDPVDELRKGYEHFARGRKWRSPFFQAARKLQKCLNPDSDESGFMWLNLFICDQNKHLPEPEVAEELRKVSFLREEVAILKPHAVVFFTGSGPNDKGPYDYTITHERYFPEAKFAPHSRWWSKVYNDPGLPTKTARTYHPNYLWHSKERGVIDEIAVWITQA